VLKLRRNDLVVGQDRGGQPMIAQSVTTKWQQNVLGNTRRKSPGPLQVFRHDPALYMLIQAAVRFHQLISGDG
jgi:hypothetical protein